MWKKCRGRLPQVKPGVRGQRVNRQTSGNTIAQKKFIQNQEEFWYGVKFDGILSFRIDGRYRGTRYSDARRQS